jgi:NTP pyrophosphatase (non-canonical NTP hydrolase)
MPRELGDLLTLKELQEESGRWRAANFDPEKRTVFHGLAGVTEEVGELAHAILKSDQGIRGTAEEHKMAAFDALGDIIVYLCSVSDSLGLSLQDAVEYAWAQVKNRDWKANPTDGKVE